MMKVPGIATTFPPIAWMRNSGGEEPVVFSGTSEDQDTRD